MTTIQYCGTGRRKEAVARVILRPGGGQIQLRWNGSTMATVSLSAASTLKQQLVTFTLPSVQSGTLSIVQWRVHQVILVSPR